MPGPRADTFKPSEIQRLARSSSIWGCLGVPLSPWRWAGSEQHLFGLRDRLHPAVLRAYA